MPPKRYGDEEFYHPEADDTTPHSADEEKAEVRTEQQGKTPGVYTRELESPQELDMLWSTNRGMYHKEDRSPIVFFLVGFLLGGLITGLIVFLLTTQPEIKACAAEAPLRPLRARARRASARRLRLPRQSRSGGEIDRT